MTSYRSENDWGGDYSYLLQSIEGTLNRQLAASPEALSVSSSEKINSKSIDNSKSHISHGERAGREDLLVKNVQPRLSAGLSVPSTSTSAITYRQKRSRLSYDSIDSPEEGSSVANSKLMKISSKATNEVTAETSKGLIFSLETTIDELRLSNEMLKDKSDSLQFELDHNRSKYERQLQFMEKEVLRLQNSLKEKNDKYYDEKKKWQLKVRGLEAEVEKLTALNQTLKQTKESTSTSRSTVSGSNDSAVHRSGSVGQGHTSSHESLDFYKQKYSDLEKEHRAKTSELSSTIQSLNNKISCLEKDSLKLAELMISNGVLLKSKDELENQLSETRMKLLSSETNLRTLQSDLSNINLLLQENVNKLSLAQHQTKLYEGEVKNLRSLLQSYEAEFKIGRPDAVKMNKLREEVITKLRQELDTIRDEASQITTKALSLQQSNPNDKADSEELASCKNRVIQLEGELSKMKEKYSALESFTRTDVLPGCNKVIHLVDNPYNQAIKSKELIVQEKLSSIPFDELKRLRKEVRNAVTTATPLDQTGDFSKDDGKSSDLPNESMVDNFHHTNTTSQVISNSGTDTNKLNQRLKEMFKERITSFREAVYLLTGYKVDLYTTDAPGDNNTVEESRRLRLRSMYAESPDDSLLFQVIPGLKS